ncbi:hypothetical protein X744_22510 [Mesorhizobium sp. LNJC372A00]|nr:hypothetical protein X745_20860 [Mesorhizobium sp. LNJC374B00]ESY55997.1 hypothetical protein X744_22510 [Mesorhizobium sp. LNJC372A00]
MRQFGKAVQGKLQTLNLSHSVVAGSAPRREFAKVFRIGDARHFIREVVRPLKEALPNKLFKAGSVRVRDPDVTLHKIELQPRWQVT